MTNAIEITAKLWPADAEMLSDDDWKRLDALASQDKVVTSKDLIQPLGESKDDLLATLMILYWTLKLTQTVIQIGKQISGLSGRAKAEAILNEVASRVHPDTPKMVSDRLNEIIDDIHES